MREPPLQQAIPGRRSHQLPLCETGNVHHSSLQTTLTVKHLALHGNGCVFYSGSVPGHPGPFGSKQRGVYLEARRRSADLFEAPRRKTADCGGKK